MNNFEDIHSDDDGDDGDGDDDVMRGIWLVQLVKYVTLDLGVVSSSPTFT